MKPEEKSRIKIDELLELSGWSVVDVSDLDSNSNKAFAIREVSMKDGTRADYILYYKYKVLAILEAKKFNNTLSGVEEQSENYANNIPDYMDSSNLFFIYESNGYEIRFRDKRDEESRSRTVFGFHKPDTLLSLATEDTTLRNRLKHNMPEIDKSDLRDCQYEAILKVEESLKNNCERTLLQMATGAGKTTLVNLIMRFYDVADGSLKLDGVDVRDYKRSLVRGVVGMVLQDTWLFKGTIRENITYGQPDASEEELISACKQAHIYHFIQTLPNGFDYMLNEDGNNISQGQRQLITIARAILSKPKVMILDEATSSVDTRTEQQIQDAMNKIMEGRTSFIIAHRLSTIKNAKLILVMKKGHIVEKGDHQSLLKANGFYAELYNSQFLGTLNNENEEKEES